MSLDKTMETMALESLTSTPAISKDNAHSISIKKNSSLFLIPYSPEVHKDIFRYELLPWIVFISTGIITATFYKSIVY